MAQFNIKISSVKQPALMAYVSIQKDANDWNYHLNYIHFIKNKAIRQHEI